MSEPKYKYETTNTSVRFWKRGIPGSLEFGVGGPIAAQTITELMDEINAMEAERDQLKHAAVLAFRAIEEVGFGKLKPAMEALDHYLANELDEKLGNYIHDAQRQFSS